MKRVELGFSARFGAAVALSGMVVGVGMLLVFERQITSRVDTVPFLIGAGVGAGIAGASTQAMFGRGGWTGWLLAYLGAFLATLMGASIASLLLLRPGQSDLGLVALLFSISTPILPVWVVLMALLHRYAAGLRRPGAAR